jgi:putative transposase
LKSTYPSLVRRLERDLPELLTCFDFPQLLWRKLRTTNAIERCFVEVRRRTRPMVLFTNLQSVERILYAIFYRFNEHGCGLYLQPVQYGYGLYLQPV